MILKPFYTPENLKSKPFDIRKPNKGEQELSNIVISHFDESISTNCSSRIIKSKKQ